MRTRFGAKRAVSQDVNAAILGGHQWNFIYALTFRVGIALVESCWRNNHPILVFYPSVGVSLVQLSLSLV